MQEEYNEIFVLAVYKNTCNKQKNEYDGGALNPSSLEQVTDKLTFNDVQ